MSRVQLSARMFRRFSALSARERRLVVETALLFAVAWAGLRVMSITSLRRLLAVSTARFSTAAAQPELLPDVTQSIRRVAARFPSSASCLVQAIAGETMLRRRGCRPELRLGVRKVRPLDAHAWLESEGVVVVGGSEPMDAYRVVFDLAQS